MRPSPLSFSTSLLALALTAVATSAVPAQELVWVTQSHPARYAWAAEAPGLPDGWQAPGFDDSAWAEGSYGLGFDAGAMIETDVPEGTKVVYTRARFVVDDLAAIVSIHFDADYDDGYVAWLNGVELARSDSMPTGPVDFDTEPANHESSNGDEAEFDTIRDVSPVALPELVLGENVLAVAVWNVDTDSSDLAIVPYLSANRPGPADGTPLCGELAGETTLTLEESPYRVTCDVTVPADGTLRIEAGVEVLVDAGLSIVVAGRLLAEGAPDARIVIRGNAGNWSGIDIDHANAGPTRSSRLVDVDLRDASRLLEVDDTGASSIVVESCRFDDWSTTAMTWHDANGLRVRNCDFGLDTAPGNRGAETLNGYGSSAVIEGCTFGLRTGYNDVIDLGDSSWEEGNAPTVRYNRFLGGEDDAIDFDGADGWIIGNVITNHWPRPGSTSSANGGGITGSAGSRTIVLNNVVWRCYHGIGYKDGVEPWIVGNLVAECNVGVTMYHADCDEDDPAAILRGNIIWGNRRETTGEPSNIVLNGRWWDDYCDDPEVQGSVDLAHNIIEGGWEGEGNIDQDPLLVDPESGDFTLQLDSPALDAGFAGPLAIPGVDPSTLAAALAIDQTGSRRGDLPCIDDLGGGDLPFADIGPFEVPLPGPCPGATPGFIRGDSNGDLRVNVSDAVHMLLALFAGLPSDDCDDARDTDDDGVTGLTDAVRLLDTLFRGASPLPPPFPEIGTDPTADGLDCHRFPFP